MGSFALPTVYSNEDIRDVADRYHLDGYPENRSLSHGDSTERKLEKIIEQHYFETGFHPTNPKIGRQVFENKKSWPLIWAKKRHHLRIPSGLLLDSDPQAMALKKKRKNRSDAIYIKKGKRKVLCRMEMRVKKRDSSGNMTLTGPHMDPFST